MNKAKIIFSSIVALAAFSGALAYKTKGVVSLFTCDGSICNQSAIKALDIQTSEHPSPYAQVVLCTTDPLCQGLACDDPNHPCTAILWTVAQ